MIKEEDTFQGGGLIWYSSWIVAFLHPERLDWALMYIEVPQDHVHEVDFIILVYYYIFWYFCVYCILFISLIIWLEVALYILANCHHSINDNYKKFIIKTTRPFSWILLDQFFPVSKWINEVLSWLFVL